MDYRMASIVLLDLCVRIEKEIPERGKQAVDEVDALRAAINLCEELAEQQ